MPNREDYIAVFDSGVGGISVLRELVKQMPGENFLYFGDSANAPYGTKSTQAVKDLTLAAADMLLKRGAKALVVACNTATSAAIDDLRALHPDTVIVGIEPAVKVAFDHFPKGKVGVLATPVTLREEKFAHLAESFPQMEIIPIPLPGLVELIESGKKAEEIEAFLHPVLAPYANKLDAVVLGCTHYPLVAPVIQKLLGQNTALLDGAAGTAQQTKRRLAAAGLLAEGKGSVRMENSSGDGDILRRCRQLLKEK